MATAIRAEERDIVRRLAALGPALGAALVIASVAIGCSGEVASTVVVPMIPLDGDGAHDGLDGGLARDGGYGGSGDAGVVELEPSPPGDAFACRRDVACGAPLAAPKGSTEHSPAPPASTASRAAPHLPSPFERCPLHDDDGRAFSARETRDARLTDPARCCYVAFSGCIRGTR